MRQLNWRHHWQVGYANFPVLYPLSCFKTLPKNFASPSLELAFTGSLILRLSSSCFSAASSACQSNLAGVQTHSWWQSSRRAMKRRCHQSSAEGVSLTDVQEVSPTSPRCAGDLGLSCPRPALGEALLKQRTLLLSLDLA